MFKADQELKQKYPLLNIIEDYEDGTTICFNKKQCKILKRDLDNYEDDFINQLNNYLKEKIDDE